jgi:hypothetical protein
MFSFRNRLIDKAASIGGSGALGFLIIAGICFIGLATIMVSLGGFLIGCAVSYRGSFLTSGFDAIVETGRRLIVGRADMVPAHMRPIREAGGNFRVEDWQKGESC